MDEEFEFTQDIAEDYSPEFEVVDDTTFFCQNPVQGVCTLAGELVDSLFWLSNDDAVDEENYAWQCADFLPHDLASLSSLLKEKGVRNTLRLANEYPVKLDKRWYHSHVEVIHWHTGEVFRRTVEIVMPNASSDEQLNTKIIEPELLVDNWDKLCQCWKEIILPEVTQWEVHVAKEYQRATRIDPTIETRKIPSTEISSGRRLKQRFTCPACSEKMKVTSKQGRVRYLKCGACGERGKSSKGQT